jgi:hypothetical protein
VGEWIETAIGSGFLLIAQFARTLRRDLRGVELPITAQCGVMGLEGRAHQATEDDQADGQASRW